VSTVSIGSDDSRHFKGICGYQAGLPKVDTSTIWSKWLLKESL